MNSTQIKNERIKYLKGVKKIANQLLTENRNLKLPTKSWRNKVIENNILCLREIIKNINKKLHEKSLKEYVEFELQIEKQNSTSMQSNGVSTLMKKTGESLMLFKMLRYSVSYSIIHDLYWIEDGTVNEQISIAIGEQSPETLGQYLNKKVEFSEKEILPYLKGNQKYKTVVSVFETAIKESKDSSYLACNILLITGIESLVRLLGKFVYTNQNPTLSEQEVDEYIFKKFASLGRLINKGDWKEDIFIELTEAIVMSEYILDESVQKAKKIHERHIETEKMVKEKLAKFSKYLEMEDIEGNEHKRKSAIKELEVIRNIGKEGLANYDEDSVGISFKTKLQFLIRGYREDRNQLIHGNFSNFDFKWKSYIYFSALKKVFKLIEIYEQKYTIIND